MQALPSHITTALCCVVFYKEKAKYLLDKSYQIYKAEFLSKVLGLK